ncbi:GNAT family N-acetyltransferase, partial [Streptomyces otsuchiensis]|uniref:GNAT family N-acetyltransferase n=1 Tax=Streptomyces otsuchiensis TaxID=2681388 RepID=UPI001031C5C9
GGGAGAVLGRFNLVEVEDGWAELGFRVAEHAAGRGLATEGARQLCARAVSDYRLTGLRASAALANAGSRRVLTRLGFRPVGTVELAGQPGTRYELRLAQAETDPSPLNPRADSTH